MYNKVIVPLDGSPLAEVALPYAEEVAGKLGTRISLLTVLSSEESEEYQNHQSYITRIADSTRRHVSKYVDNSANKEIIVEAATRSGSPAEGILNFTSKGYPSLIIMATHGRSGISRWAVGSIADKIVRSTSLQPIMLIRAHGSHPEVRAKRILKKALVPLDGSTESEAVIPFITEIARSLKMETTLLRVIPKSNHPHTHVENYLRNWCERIKQDELSADYSMQTGAAAEEIIDLADNLACDLVAMSTRGQTATSLWSLGSVAQKVLLGGNTPLLLIKA
jgi:nucleotide-binding universal stress UspA family protein